MYLILSFTLEDKQRHVDFPSIFQQITPAKDGKPVIIELIDAKTKELKETLEVIQLTLKKMVV